MCNIKLLIGKDTTHGSPGKHLLMRASPRKAHSYNWEDWTLTHQREFSDQLFYGRCLNVLADESQAPSEQDTLEKSCCFSFHSLCKLRLNAIINIMSNISLETAKNSTFEEKAQLSPSCTERLTCSRTKPRRGFSCSLNIPSPRQHIHCVTLLKFKVGFCRQCTGLCMLSARSLHKYICWECWYSAALSEANLSRLWSTNRSFRCGWELSHTPPQRLLTRSREASRGNICSWIIFPQKWEPKQFYSSPSLKTQGA